MDIPARFRLSVPPAASRTGQHGNTHSHAHWMVEHHVPARFPATSKKKLRPEILPAEFQRMKGNGTWTTTLYSNRHNFIYK